MPTTLDDASRTKLDGIVQQMQTNKEPDANIQAVVDDFKTKYSTQQNTPSASAPVSQTGLLGEVGKAAGVLGGEALKQGANIGKGIANFILGPAETVGTRLGQGAAYLTGKAATAITGNPALENKVASRLQQPMTTITGGTVNPLQPGTAGVKQLGGEALNAGLMYAPVGRIAQGATAGLKAAGVGAKTAGALGTVGTGAATGYGFDQANQLAQGQTPDLKPGLGTAIGTILPGVAEGIGSTRGLLFPASIEANAQKALGNVGKVGLKDAAGAKPQQYTKGLSVINELAPNITVKDAAGVEKPFNPSKATYQELPQALYQAKNQIYDQYSRMASEAGDKGAFFGQPDFEALITDLKKYEGPGFTPAFSSKAQQIVQAIERFGSKNPETGAITYKNVPPGDVQKLVESINLDVNPLSDRAGSQVANEASTQVRKELDKKIESAAGPGYQALRDKYAALKSIEPQVIAQWKKAANKNPLVSPIFDAVGTVDFLQGILTKSPTEALRGGLWSMVGHGVSYLRDKEKNLQEAFRLMSTEPRPSLGQKLLNLAPGNALAKKGGLLERGTANAVKTSATNLKESGGGLAIKRDTSISTTPQAVAQKAGILDIFKIRDFLANHQDPGMAVRAETRIEPLLKQMGISKLDPATQKRFLGEVVSEFDQIQPRHPQTQRWLPKK